MDQEGLDNCAEWDSHCTSPHHPTCPSLQLLLADVLRTVATQGNTSSCFNMLVHSLLTITSPLHKAGPQWRMQSHTHSLQGSLSVYPSSCSTPEVVMAHEPHPPFIHLNPSVARHRDMGISTSRHMTTNQPIHNLTTHTHAHAHTHTHNECWRPSRNATINISWPYQQI